MKAIKNHKGKEKEDLSFEKGQIITILGKNDDKGLFQGEILSKKGSKVGWFPYSVVKPLTEKELEEVVQKISLSFENNK